MTAGAGMPDGDGGQERGDGGQGHGAGEAAGGPPAETWHVPAVSPVPGERRYRDGQKVRHRVFGEGQVVSSKLTRDDEEVTVAFPGQGVKKLMASLAGLEVQG
jgi:DNA helicase-2/ATP-dependent DNA helicase PcrA